MATIMARYSVLKYRGFKSCAVIQQFPFAHSLFGLTLFGKDLFFSTSLHYIEKCRPNKIKSKPNTKGNVKGNKNNNNNHNKDNVNLLLRKEQKFLRLVVIGVAKWGT